MSKGKRIKLGVQAVTADGMSNDVSASGKADAGYEHHVLPTEIGGVGRVTRPEGSVRATYLYVANVIADLLENGEGDTRIVENKFPANPEILLSEFLPREYRQRILELSADMEEGVYHRAKWVVGDREKGTQHGHYFYLLKDRGKVKIFFVDPERIVGSRHRFRPSVTNLVAAEIPESDSIQPRFAILRYRHREPALSTGQSHSELCNAAFSLIANHGSADFLEDESRYELTFRIVGGDRYQIVESRHGDEAHLRSFLNSGMGCTHLAGKAFAQRAILRTFIRKLDASDFLSWRKPEQLG